MATARIGTPARMTAWAAGLAVVLALAACTPMPDATGEPLAVGSAPAPAPSPSAPDAPIESPGGDAVEDVAEAVIAMQGGPDLPIEGFGSMWFLAPDDEPALVRVDPATNEVVALILLPGRLCQGIVASDDAIWFCTADGAGWVDPATNAIAGSSTYPAAAGAISLPRFGRMAFGAGAVWDSSSDASNPNAVIRIDPATQVATAIPLGHEFGALAFGFDALWVTAPADGLLLRVDPTTNEVTELAGGLPAPLGIFAGPDSLWVTLHGSDDAEPAATDPTVIRIDPSDGTILAEIPTGAPVGTDGELWAGDEAVWVRAPNTFLTRIDPATNAVTDTFSGPGSSGALTVAFGSLWATSVEFNDVYRLRP